MQLSAKHSEYHSDERGKTFTTQTHSSLFVDTQKMLMKCSVRTCPGPLDQVPPPPPQLLLRKPAVDNPVHPTKDTKVWVHRPR